MLDERIHAQRWLGVAVLSLVLAGTLSLVLVVGRLPVLCELFDDPLFFRRGLVVHVDLALVVWFNAFLAGLAFLVPSRRRSSRVARAGAAVAVLGVLLLLVAAGVPGAQPILANYVPAIDHPLFGAGLAVFGVGVLLAVLDPRLSPSVEAADGFFPVPPSARVGIRAGVVVVIASALTFLSSVLDTPRELPNEAYYELVAWGGGHTLQVAAVCGMLSVWLILLGRALGEDPVDRRVATVLFAVLVVPTLAGPWLALGAADDIGRQGAFTQLMRWGIFPVVLAFLALSVRALRRRPRRDGSGPLVAAFAASALLTVAGFVLGAMIRGSNTLVPGHYHAAIGAVTVVYMALTYPLLEAMGMHLPAGRMRRVVAWQPPLFGVGQAVFAVGFGIAGAAGQLRKSYGAEQHVTSWADAVGLTVMAAGGVVAVVAGVAFLVVVVRAWLGARETVEGGFRWRTESIRSSG